MKLEKPYNKQYKTNYMCAIPTNVYGPHDNFDTNNSHVIPALIIKFHTAKIKEQKLVKLWGTGNPVREFIYADDVAEACLFLMKNYNSSEIINIGSGEEISIKNLAYRIKDIIGYHGEITFDTSMPDGAPRKVLDGSKLKNIGWEAKTSLQEGIRKTYQWYLNL